MQKIKKSLLLSILYIKVISGFGVGFSLSVIPLNKFIYNYKNIISLILFIKIRIYIIFIILFVLLKK